MKKRGYSRAFTPRTARFERYLLDKIPPTLWARVKAASVRKGVSLRAAILHFLDDWSREP